MKKYFILVMVAMFMLLAGCSEDSSKTAASDNKSKQETGINEKEFLGKEEKTTAKAPESSANVFQFTKDEIT